MYATLTIAGTIAGLPSGTKTLGVTITLPAPIAETLDLALAVGDNVVTVPSGATVALLVPPATNTAALLLKHVTGDAGVGLHVTNPTLLSLAAGTTSFIVNAGTGAAGSLEVSFV